MSTLPPDFGFLGQAPPLPQPKVDYLPPPECAKPLIGTAVTVSGRVLQFSAVLLFDVHSIATAERIHSEAQQNLKGFSSGIGFIGNAPFVVGAMLLRTVVEAGISNSMAQQGVKLLEEHFQYCRRVRASGQFIPLSFVQNIRVPAPNTWRYIQKAHDEGIVAGFLHNGDPCVVLQLTNGPSATILWDKIEQWDIIDAL